MKRFRIALTWWHQVRIILLAGVLAPAVMAVTGWVIARLAGRYLMLKQGPSLHQVGWALLTAIGSLLMVNALSKLHPSIERALKQTGTESGLQALRTAGYPVMVVIVIAAAFGEELLFRGGLQPVVGVAAAAVLFGISHGGWRREMWAYVIAASLSGLFFGVLYAWTGNVWAPIAAHALHNTASVVLLGKRFVLARGRWQIPVIRLVPDQSVDEEEQTVSGDDAPPVGPWVGTAQSTPQEQSGQNPWPSPYPQRQTAREVGIVMGRLPTGPQNDLCDVAGVRVGHATVAAGEGSLQPGEGPVRTGVTVILPHGGNLFAQKVPAGLFVLNGFGKSIGLAQVAELGTVETPILLTNTLSAFHTADVLVTSMIEQNPAIGISTGTVNPVVGECNDGWLNDIQGRHVGEQHVRAALADALSTEGTGPLRQGAVGAGTGMVCFGFKGGIGSASRRAGDYTVGALIQANFGRRHQLLVRGVPVGQHLIDHRAVEPEPQGVPPGSAMVIIATDAPLDARQLTRLAKRAALGLGRVGSSASNGSGEFILAFGTANRVPHEADEPIAPCIVLRDGSKELDLLFEATVEAAEEAVLNALFTAATVTGRDGHVAPALPVAQVLAHVMPQ